jgi:hypothetical protein
MQVFQQACKMQQVEIFHSMAIEQSKVHRAVRTAPPCCNFSSFPCALNLLANMSLLTELTQDLDDVFTLGAKLGEG